MDKSKRDIQGLGLSLLNRFAGSDTVDKLGLRKPAEKALFTASKASFGAASLANSPFQAVRKLLQSDDQQQANASALFDLTPTDEQAMMQDATRRFAEEILRPAAEDAENYLEPSEDVWTQANALGLAQLAVPERLGGVATERSVLTSALVAESLGWGDMGQACALLAPVGVANALAHWGNAEQQVQYLTAFSADSPPDAAFAMIDTEVAPDPMRPRCLAREDGDHWVINGEKRLVPLGRFAELFIVSVDCDKLGPRLLLVEKNAEGLSRHPDESMGLRGGGLGRVRFDKVRVARSALLGDDKAFADAVHLARLMWCSLAVGCGQAVLDTVSSYVNDRKAFGEPLSHRQAVAFMVADIATEVDAMRLMTWRALARYDQGLDFHREAILAHCFCSEHAMDIGSNGVQLLGGHGFVKEFPVERWYRDLRAVGVQEGGLLA